MRFDTCFDEMMPFKKIAGIYSGQMTWEEYINTLMWNKEWLTSMEAQEELRIKIMFPPYITQFTGPQSVMPN